MENQGSFPSRGVRIYPVTTTSKTDSCHTQSANRCHDYFPWELGRSKLKLPAYLHPESTLRTRGILPPRTLWGHNA
jgi:hypothetical protein